MSGLQPLRRQLETFSGRLVTYSFLDLLDDMRYIEDQAQELAAGALAELLEGASVSVDGGDLVYEGRAYSLSSGGAGRNLSIELAPLRSPARTRKRTVHLSGVGRVGHVDVRIDSSIAAALSAPDAASAVAASYCAAYAALEDAYALAFGRWCDPRNPALYGIMNAALAEVGRSDLRYRFWYSISDRKQATFRYEFDEGSIRTAFAQLRSERTGVSAIDVVSLLATQRVRDAIFEKGSPAYQRGSHFIVRFSDLPTHDADNEFWMAERLLYGHAEELAAHEVADAGGEAIQLNCDAAHAETIGVALKSVRGDLTTIINHEARAYRHRQTRQSKAIARSAAGARSWLREYSLDLLERVVLGLLKG